MAPTQILIIDDEPAIQMLLYRTLSRQGYDVLTASSGTEGIAKALEHRPSLIICDWLMPPGMSGLDVCHEIKANPELSTTFFILLTSLNSVEDRVKGLDAGSDDFLCKPIEKAELNARVRAGLRLHQLSIDLKQQKQRLEAELAEAAEYASALLPKPISGPPLTIDTRFIPSRQLGGDCFDYYWLDNDHLAMYLLDVSGHGLRAALPSLWVLNLLRSKGLTQVNFYRPNEVLKGLNKTLEITKHNEEEYFTIWYGVYNTKKRRLVYSSAGHPPAILLSPDRQEGFTEQRLTTRNFPIGFFPDSQYTESCCQIRPSSVLYIFSDGIYEIEQKNGTIWGIDNFINILKSQQKNAFNLDQIFQKVKAFNERNYFADDLSIMQIYFH